MRARLGLGVLLLLLPAGCSRPLPTASLEPALRKTSALGDAEVKTARRAIQALDAILAGKDTPTATGSIVGIEPVRYADRPGTRPDLERWILHRPDGQKTAFLVKFRPGGGPIVFAEQDTDIVRKSLSPDELRDLKAMGPSRAGGR